MAEGKNFLPPPVQVGGSLGELPSLEGARNTANSPELFPDLEIGTYQFLYRMALAAISLEEKLSLALTPKREKQLFVPPSVREVVNVAERLVLCKPADKEELKSGPGAKERQPRDYLPYRLDEKETSISRDNRVVKQIEESQIHFCLPKKGSRKGSDRKDPPILVTFYPRTKREMYGKNGRSISEVSGLKKEEGIRLLSLRGWSAEEVAEVAKTWKESFPSFEIKRGNSVFRAEFRDGFAFCEITVRGGKYERNTAEMKPSTYAFKSATVKVPLSEFRVGNETFDPNSQDQVEKWLNNVALDLDAKIRLSKV